MKTEELTSLKFTVNVNWYLSAIVRTFQNSADPMGIFNFVQRVGNWHVVWDSHYQLHTNDEMTLNSEIY